MRLQPTIPFSRAVSPPAPTTASTRPKWGLGTGSADRNRDRRRSAQLALGIEMGISASFPISVQTLHLGALSPVQAGGRVASAAGSCFRPGAPQRTAHARHMQSRHRNGAAPFLNCSAAVWSIAPFADVRARQSTVEYTSQSTALTWSHRLAAFVRYASLAGSKVIPSQLEVRRAAEIAAEFVDAKSMSLSRRETPLSVHSRRAPRINETGVR